MQLKSLLSKNVGGFVCGALFVRVLCFVCLLGFLHNSSKPIFLPEIWTITSWDHVSFHYNTTWQLNNIIVWRTIFLGFLWIPLVSFYAAHSYGRTEINPYLPPPLHFRFCKLPSMYPLVLFFPLKVPSQYGFLHAEDSYVHLIIFSILL